MLPSTALHDFNALPPIAQEQVIDFIAFVKARYQKTQHELKSIEHSFGAIHVQKRVSLEQMDEAIKQGGVL
jgi:hypothetical protein